MFAASHLLKRLPLFALSAVALGGEPVPLVPDPGAPLTPIRAARITMTPDGRYQLAGPWIELGGPATRDRFGPVFDCFDLASIVVASAHLPHVANDMTVSAAHAGRQATRVSFAWVWGGDGNGNAAPCTVTISTFDGFRGCDDPDPSPGDSFLDGIFYDFGLLPPSPSYNVADVDLSGSGLYHTMPTSGSGAYDMAYFHSFDSEPMLAPSVFPVYSSTGDDDDPPTPRPGTQGPFEFDDNNPPDGVFDIPDECVDRSSPTPPYERGPAIRFSVKGTCACTGDVDEDGDVDIQDMALLLGLFGQSGPFEYPCADVNFDGSIGLSDLTLLTSNFGLPC